MNIALRPLVLGLLLAGSMVSLHRATPAHAYTLDPTLTTITGYSWKPLPRWCNRLGQCTSPEDQITVYSLVRDLSGGGLEGTITISIVGSRFASQSRTEPVNGYPYTCYPDSCSTWYFDVPPNEIVTISAVYSGGPYEAPSAAAPLTLQL